MLIKAGILSTPDYDEEAVGAIRHLLASEVRSVVVLQEQRVAMQRHLVEEVLRRWADEEELDLIVTIGGTLPASGPGHQEAVPEATLAVAERLMPGLPQAMRSYAAGRTPLAWLDRSVAVIRGRTLILNLPAGAATAACFLAPVVALLAPIVAHLQGDPTAPAIEVAGDVTQVPLPAPGAASQPAAPSGSSGRRELDPAEFAVFLQRRQQDG